MGDLKPLIDAEVWRDIVGYEGCYLISSFGNVYSQPRTEFVNSKRTGGHHRYRNGMYIVPRINNTGYLQVGLHLDSKYKRHSVHRLVATAFIENTDSLKEVNHKDGNRLNNCVTNLEWASRSMNAQHAADFLGMRGENVGTSKLTEEQVLSIKYNLEHGLTQTEIARCYNVSPHAIFRIQRGHNWSWLTGYEKKGKETSCAH